MNKICTLLIGALMSFSLQAFTPQSLWQQWPQIRYEKTTSACLRPEGLQQALRDLAITYPQSLRLEKIGESYQGRPIRMLSLGKGKQNILLWSQMHGDEPSATPALLDIVDFLLSNTDQAAIRSILEKYTLLMIPMLNPDGSAIYERYNAQGVDINRDALRLVTPEGRLLKRIRDQYKPVMGFNLHDQGRRTAVGNTGRLATNSVLSVSGDEANTLTPGRLLTKRAATAVVEALAPIMPGGVARYDEDWSPRAFGDNLTAWGTPVLLIESGGLPPGFEFSDLSRLNFVAILTVLKGLSDNELANYDPGIYENLPRNQSRSWSDYAVRGGYLMQPGANGAFQADLVFDVLHNDQQLAGCSDDDDARSSVFMVGDASLHATGQSVDASGQLILAAFDAGLNGWERREWLNKANLSAWAKLGIGTIFWAVQQDERQQALSHARDLMMPGKPRIMVVTAPSALPAVVLKAPPPSKAPQSLTAILDLLAVAHSGQLSDLSGMWVFEDQQGPGSPRLRRRSAATFLLLTFEPEAEQGIADSQLLSIWLDGRKIR